MLKKEEEIRDNALLTAAQEILLSLRTAPKTRGIDNISLLIATDNHREILAAKMNELNERSGGQRPSFSRDAKGVLAAPVVILIGVKSPPYALNCGWCGFPVCAEKTAKSPKAPCAFGAIDLGIAAGVAASKLGEKHIDNRMMFSIGQAALDLGWFDKETTMSLGFPLSATGKNPFFDRK